MRQASSNKCNEKLFVGTKKKISYVLGSRKGGDHAIIANTIPIGFSPTTAATSCYSTKFEQPTTAFDFIVTLQLLRHFGEPLLASPREGFKVLGETQSCNSSKPVT
jgi:hypothetical protein